MHGEGASDAISSKQNVISGAICEMDFQNVVFILFRAHISPELDVNVCVCLEFINLPVGVDHLFVVNDAGAYV